MPKTIASREEFDAKEAERTRIKERINVLDKEILEIKAAARRVLDRGCRPGYSKRWDEIRKELMDRRTELVTINQWFREHGKVSVAKARGGGTNDPYAIQNALSEPLMLLRHVHKRMKTAFSRTGFCDGDRALLDSVGDYLFRMGVFVTKNGD